MTKRDWVLLSLFAAEGHSLQPVQLQKSLFLLGQSGTVNGRWFFKFVPYDYGPYSRAIYDEADVLRDEGLVAVTPSPHVKWRQYSLSSAGRDEATALVAKASPRAWSYLGSAVEWVQSLSFTELVRSIYAHFPDFKRNSVFQES